MHDLTPGHQHLKYGRFKEADEYFSVTAKFFKNDSKTVNGCLYGQARAMMGLQNYSAATTLLLCVINNVPRWEAPYISLARVYESQGNHYRMLGMHNESNGMFKKAEQTFLDAINNTDRSPRLAEHYEYFLREHAALFAAPAKGTPSFTPGFGSMRKGTAVAVQPNSAQQEALELKLSKLSIKTA